MANDASAPDRVHLALHQLSDSAATINEASDVLRKTISALETTLKKLNLGVSAWVTIAEGGTKAAENRLGKIGDSPWSREVGYTRLENYWCIALRTVKATSTVFGSKNEEKQWAFNDAPRWMRVEAVSKLPDLLERLAEQANDTAKKIKSKSEEAGRLAAALEAVAEPLEEMKK